MSLKLGITIPTYTWPDMDYRMAHTVVQDYSRRTEELGFESLTVWDHLTDAPGLYGGSWMDPLICLSAAAAACTERIKLGTHILVLPLRHPVLLAKEIATLDYISGGRFFFGVGPWLEQARVRRHGHRPARAGTPHRRDPGCVQAPPHREARFLQGRVLRVRRCHHRPHAAQVSGGVGGRGARVFPTRCRRTSPTWSRP